GQLRYPSTIISKMVARDGIEPPTQGFSVLCSTDGATDPLYNYIICMEEEEGFEPPRALTHLSVFKTDPFSQPWVFLHITRMDPSWMDPAGFEPATDRL